MVSRWLPVKTYFICLEREVALVAIGKMDWNKERGAGYRVVDLHAAYLESAVKEPARGFGARLWHC